jgi:protein FAM50
MRQVIEIYLRQAKKANKKKKILKSTLSFGGIDDQEEEIEEAAPVKKRKLGKDPTVSTEFLPDHERDENARNLREKLKEEWIAEQVRVKGDLLACLESITQQSL